MQNNPIRFTDPTGHVCYDSGSDAASPGNCGGDSTPRTTRSRCSQMPWENCMPPRPAAKPPKKPPTLTTETLISNPPVITIPVPSTVGLNTPIFIITTPLTPSSPPITMIIYAYQTASQYYKEVYTIPSFDIDIFIVPPLLVGASASTGVGSDSSGTFFTYDIAGNIAVGAPDANLGLEIGTGGWALTGEIGEFGISLESNGGSISGPMGEAGFVYGDVQVSGLAVLTTPASIDAAGGLRNYGDTFIFNKNIAFSVVAIRTDTFVNVYNWHNVLYATIPVIQGP